MLNENCGESWQSLLSDDQETEAKAYTAKDKYKTRLTKEETLLAGY